jgi:hypothetical protein
VNRFCLIVVMPVVLAARGGGDRRHAGKAPRRSRHPYLFRDRVMEGSAT